MKIDIRAAGSADIAQIADFNRRLAAESEGTDLDEALTGWPVHVITDDLSPAGRLWTIFLVVGGISIIGYTATRAIEFFTDSALVESASVLTRTVEAGVVAGAMVAGALIFLPFAIAAPRAFWFGLVEYHQLRSAGRGVEGVAAGYGRLNCS